MTHRTRSFKIWNNYQKNECGNNGNCMKRMLKSGTHSKFCIFCKFDTNFRIFFKLWQWLSDFLQTMTLTFVFSSNYNTHFRIFLKTLTLTFVFSSNFNTHFRILFQLWHSLSYFLPTMSTFVFSANYDTNFRIFLKLWHYLSYFFQTMTLTFVFSSNLTLTLVFSSSYDTNFRIFLKHDTIFRISFKLWH